MVHFAANNTLAFQFAQLLDEHFFTNATHMALEFAKAQRLFINFPQDKSLPFATDDVEGWAEAAGEGSIAFAHYFYPNITFR